MHPVLLQTDLLNQKITINAYPVFLVMAALTLIGVATILASRRGIPYRRSLPILLLMGMTVLVGARLLNYLIRPEIYAADPTLLYSFKSYGFSLYGGLVLAVIVGTISSRQIGANVFDLADATAPALGLSIAIMRVGCFMAGCCFGKETQLPWGVTYPMFSLAHWAQIRDGQAIIFQYPLPVHPTQLYELQAALCCGGVAYFVLNKKVAPGTAFAAFFLLFSAFRWFNLGLRYQISSALPSYFYPLLYSAICFLSTLYILYFNFWSRPKPD